MISKGGPGLGAWRGLFGALALVPCLALGCGDDSPGTGGSSGSGGGAGTGGSGGSGGTVAGSSGASGSAGTSGSSGSAGASAGGSAGSGAGGSAGNDAGTTGGRGGTAGSSGAGGSAGSGGKGGTDAGGPATDAGGGPDPKVVVLSPTGHDRLFGVVHDAAGNIYATGSIASGTDSATDHAMVLAKFLPTGALDTTFGTNGFVTHNVAVGTSGEMARGIVVQSTGKIVISGSVEHAGGDPRDRDVALVRFTPQGAVDTTFGTNGVRILDLSSGEVMTADGGTSIVAENTWGLSVFPNDDLVVAGARKADGRNDTDFALTKLKADGATDTTFGTMGTVSVDVNMASGNPKTAAILPDGSIVMSGYMSSGGVVTPVLFKVSPTGVLDPSFGVAGVFNQAVLAAATEVYGAVLQGTNFVTNGYGRQTTSESLDFLSLRITPAGTLDTTYGTNGVTRIDAAGFNDNGRGVALLPDNRVLLLGGGRPSMSEVDGMVAVLTPNGQPDTTFAPAGFRLYDLGGPNDFFWSASTAPDKKSVAIVGLKGAASGGDAGMPSNDDSAILVLPLTP